MKIEIKLKTKDKKKKASSQKLFLFAPAILFYTHARTIFCRASFCFIKFVQKEILGGGERREGKSEGKVFNFAEKVFLPLVALSFLLCFLFLFVFFSRRWR